MKKSLFILGIAAAFGLGLPIVNQPVVAADTPSDTTNNKPTREEKRQADLEKYDTNNDGKLDKDERAARKADKEAEKQAKLLAKYDKNGNGKLDPDEEAAMKADQEKHAHKHPAKPASSETEAPKPPATDTEKPKDPGST